MKKKRISKLTFKILVILIIVGFLLNVKAAEVDAADSDTVVLNASDINKITEFFQSDDMGYTMLFDHGYPRLGLFDVNKNCIINIDMDITLYRIEGNVSDKCSITIRGDGIHKLTIEDFVIVSSDMDIENAIIQANGAISSSENVSIKNSVIDCDALYSAEKTLDITNSNITTESSGRFSPYCVSGGKNIILKDCKIAEPNGGRIEKIYGDVDSKTGDTIYCYVIVDNNGKNPKSVMISNGKAKVLPPTYKNEWVDGKWYNADGTQTYTGTLQWKQNATDWWVEDTDGWYPQNQWQKIDGIWYYFKPDGYMASNEYYNGYWFNKDGSWNDQYYLSWNFNSTGWWVEDKSGWWPQSSWLKLDGYWYYFDASGYMVTSRYIDGWWIDADGVCR